MKKLFALALTTLMILGMFAGCGSSDAEVGGNKFNLQTVNDGVLTVATSPDYAPFEFYSLDENGKPTLAGFDMALAQYLADYMDLKLEIVPMDFDGTITELGNKMCDLSMAGYSPDPDRLIYMDFSDIYYTSEQAFVTVKANADAVSSMAAANNPDVQIGVQIGSIQADLAKENTPDADIVELSKVTDIIAELTSGKLDAAYIETPVVMAYANNYPDLTIVEKVPFEGNGSVLGVSKDNAELLKVVNEAIAASKADGSFDKFLQEAIELAAGATFEGLLDENGNTN